MIVFLNFHVGRKGRHLIILLALLTIACPALSKAPVLKGESEGMEFGVYLLAERMGVPWGMTWQDRENLIITQRSGELYRMHRDGGRPQRITGVPEVMAEGQGGLLDVHREPDSGWFYFTYSKAVADQGATTLARARLEGSTLVDWQDLIVTQSRTDTGRHYGSRIAFDGEGHVFFGIGDRGVRPNGQRLDTHAGSVLRLTLDGDVPEDNPFVGKADALPEIWSYGHRNPQGLSFDPVKMRLWLIEHGPRGGDEINRVLPGRNYGWPEVSYGKEYWAPMMVGEATEKPGIESPVKYYDPSIAPGSLIVYRGAAFPKWQGNLFSGALKLTHLNRVILSEDGKAVAEERLIGDMNERVRALLEGPEGWLYFTTDSGKLYVIRPD